MLCASAQYYVIYMLALVRTHNSTYMYWYAVHATLYCTSTAAVAILAAILAVLHRLSVGQSVRLCCGGNTKAAAVAEKSKQQQKKKRKEKKRSTKETRTMDDIDDIDGKPAYTYTFLCIHISQSVFHSNVFIVLGKTLTFNLWNWKGKTCYRMAMGSVLQQIFSQHHRHHHHPLHVHHLLHVHPPLPFHPPPQCASLAQVLPPTTSSSSSSSSVSRPKASQSSPILSLESFFSLICSQR